MRLLRSLVWLVALGGLGILALLFLVQNLHTERLVFFGVVSTLNFAWALVGAAAFGFLLALVLIVPGRIATALYARMLDRELRQLEQRLAHLSEQRERLMDGREQLLLHYERLFAKHDQVLAERERLRAQLGAATATSVGDRAADESALGVTPSRQPLALREREMGRVARAAPVRIAPLSGVTANAQASSAVAESAPARVSSGRILPPVPVVPDPPVMHTPPAALVPDPPVALIPPAASEPLVTSEEPSPDPSGSADMRAASASTPVDRMRSAATGPLEQGRPRQGRERLARISAAAGERWAQWRRQAGRVRRSAGAMYNDMRTTLLARARSAASRGRTPYAPTRRDDAPTEISVPSTSTPAASVRDEDGHESTALKGEHPLWRPPE